MTERLTIASLPMNKYIAWHKRVLFVVCCVPLAYLIYKALIGGLGVNPIEATTRFLADWGLRFLLITLALTPLRLISGFAYLTRFRRMLGLFAFFYVFLHMMSYAGLDQFFYWPEIWRDIIKRKYITFGFIAFVMLSFLAVTSTDAMVRRIGGHRWQRLHSLVYPAGIAAVVHFFYMTKADYTQPVLYAAFLAIILGYRLFRRYT